MNQARTIPLTLIAMLCLSWSGLAQASSLASTAIVVKLSLDLNGNSILIDSYDSSDATKSTSGLYDPAKAQDHGGIVSQYGDLSIGNTRIKGKILTGMTNNVFIGPNGSVGDSAWVDSGMRGIKPGWVQKVMPTTIPDVIPPYNSGMAPTGPITVKGTTYTFGLGSGDYYLNGDMAVSNYNPASIIVSSGANARVYVTGNVIINTLVLPADATLKLYVGNPSGAHVSIDLQGLNIAGKAGSLQIHGLPTATSISLSGDGLTSATIYAPGASMTINGAGPNVSDWLGYVLVNSLTLNGHFNFHYDEDLIRALPLTIALELTNQIPTGGTAQAKVLANYPNISANDVTADPNTIYQTSDPNVITVTTNGLITAHNPGSALVTASYRGAVASNTVSVIEMVTPPILSVVLSGSDVIVSWPTNSFTFVLQQNFDLTMTNWLDVTNSPIVVGDQNQVILAPSDTNAFFRLKFP